MNSMTEKTRKHAVAIEGRVKLIVCLQTADASRKRSGAIVALKSASSPRDVAYYGDEKAAKPTEAIKRRNE